MSLPSLHALSLNVSTAKRGRDDRKLEELYKEITDEEREEITDKNRLRRYNLEEQDYENLRPVSYTHLTLPTRLSV